MEGMSEALRQILKELRATPRKPPRDNGPPFNWREAAYSAKDLKTQTFPPMRDVIPGLLTEGVTLLAGKPKKGKTWMAIDIAIATTAHRYCLGEFLPHRGDVLYIALEDNQRRMQRRIKQILFDDDVPWPERLTIIHAWRRVDQGGIDDLAAWLGEHPQARLIVIDTFSAIRPLKTDYGFMEDYAALSGLQQLAGRHGIAILVVHHLRKAGADDFGDEISGTLGLTAAVDAYLVLRSSNDNGGGHSKAELCLRSRDIEEQTFGATFSAETCRWTLDRSSSADRSKNRILAVLAESDEPLSPAEIMRLSGLTRNIVDIHLSRMRRAGEVHRTEDKKYSLGQMP